MHTKDVIKEIANNISEELKVTYDVESNYSDRKVPILDLKVGINNENKIEYHFYQKPMCNKTVILKNSAFSMNQKISSLTQECFRRLHNTSAKINEEIKIQILNEFMQSLHCSGYSENDRLNILKGGINTYIKLKCLELSGKRPFYRPNNFERIQRDSSKLKKKTNWFKSDNCESKFKSVLFVDATPGDRLLKMIKSTENQYKIAEDKRIKIVSRAGVKLVNIFERKNPFAKSENECDCGLTDENDRSETRTCKCRINSVSYQAKCITCESQGINKIYDGETARNLLIRSNEHMNDLKNGKTNSFMKKHIEKDHQGIAEGVKFAWKVLMKHRKPLRRQLHEAVNIKNKPSNENLNSKSEFHGQRINRVHLEKKYDCKTCGTLESSKQNLDIHVKKFHKSIKCLQCEEMCFGESGLKEHMKTLHIIA